MSATFNPSSAFLYATKPQPVVVTYPGGASKTYGLTSDNASVVVTPSFVTFNNNDSGQFSVLYNDPDDDGADFNVTLQLVDKNSNAIPGATATYQCGVRTANAPIPVGATDYALDDGQTKLDLEFSVSDGTGALMPNTKVQLLATKANIRFYSEAGVDITVSDTEGNLTATYTTGAGTPPTVKGSIGGVEAGIYTIEYGVQDAKLFSDFTFIVAPQYLITGGLGGLKMPLTGGTLQLGGRSTVFVQLSDNTIPPPYTEDTSIVLIANQKPMPPYGQLTFADLRIGYPLSKLPFKQGTNNNTLYYMVQSDSQNPDDNRSTMIRFSAQGTVENYPDATIPDQDRPLPAVIIQGVSIINDAIIQGGTLSVTFPGLDAAYMGAAGHYTVYVNGYSSQTSTSIDKVGNYSSNFTASTADQVLSVDATSLWGYMTSKDNKDSYLQIDYYVISPSGGRVYSKYSQPGWEVNTSRRS